MDLSKILGGTPGTWSIGGFRLPDYSLTEAMTGGGSNFQNPLVRFADKPQPQPQKTVLGSATSAINTNRNTNNQNNPNNPNNNNEQDFGRNIVDEAYRAALDQAGRLRSSGRQTFDDLIRAVGAFRDRAKVQRDNAGQEITNRFGEIMGQTGIMGRQTATDAARRGRAMGLGDSSKFRNQNLVQGNLALQQGGNMAKKGDNERANEDLYQGRLTQADDQENEANRYLRDINDSASAVESGGVANYANDLSNLIQRNQMLASLRPMNAGALQQYQTDTSGMINNLNGVLASMQGRQIQGGDMAGNLASPVTFQDLIRRGQKPLVS